MLLAAAQQVQQGKPVADMPLRVRVVENASCANAIRPAPLEPGEQLHSGGDPRRMDLTALLQRRLSAVLTLRSGIRRAASARVC